MSSPKHPGLRLPPQHLESEKALLGSIMLRTESLYDIGDILVPEAFYADKHRVIFESMLDLHRKREPIDLLTLAIRLEEGKHLEQIGGRSYLTELAQTVPSSANAKYYADMVRKKHIMRNLIQAADHISDMGYKEEKGLEELLDEAERKIFSVTNIASHQGIINIKDALKEAKRKKDTKELSEDDVKVIEKAIDKLVGDYQDKIEGAFKVKEQDILKI